MEPANHRIAIVSMVVRDRTVSERVNNELSKHGNAVRGRLGIPFPEKGLSVITVVMEADSDRIGAISGVLGTIPGVTLRTAMLT